MKKYILLAIFVFVIAVGTVYSWDDSAWDSFRNALRNLKYSIIPHSDDSLDLGSPTKEFKDYMLMVLRI